MRSNLQPHDEACRNDRINLFRIRFDASCPRHMSLEPELSLSHKCSMPILPTGIAGNGAYVCECVLQPLYVRACMWFPLLVTTCT